MTDECPCKQGHNWYLTYWSLKRKRHERECMWMGCNAWQYLEGTVVAKEAIVVTKEGKEHVHDWTPWNGTSQDTVDDGLRYFRNCRNCKAEEGTGDLRDIGNWIYFPAEVAIRG